MLERLWKWFDDRLDLAYFTHLALKKEVPVHRYSWAYFTGGIVLFLLFVQLATGILLLLYYRPSSDEAFASVRFIMTDVSFGWLIRSVHSWSANLVIGFAFFHMFTTFFTKAFRKPRELTWISGVFLFFLLLAFGFSGYLLPWNQLSFFATRVGTDIPAAVPLVGKAIAVFLRGGDQVTGGTLTRFFGFHVAILPALTTLLVMFHVSLIQKQGMSVPPSVEKDSSRFLPFFPNVFLRDVTVWYVILGVLVLLATFYPWELGEEANPFGSTPSNIHPEWYFLFMFETLRLTPAYIFGLEGERVVITAFAAAAFLWLLVPFWAAPLMRRGHGRIVEIIGVVVCVYIVVLTAIAVLR
jgi:quinol-cytochrome oxidoreductase complex cytochrome b subunit